MFEHILVPLDGTECSEEVLPYVRRLVCLGASHVTLVRTELPVAMDEYAIISETALDQARQYLEGLRSKLGDLKADIRIVAALGSPASTVLETAEAKQASLILISSARRTRVERFLFGSVPDRIVQRSRTPVLVIPPHWPPKGGPARSPEECPIRTLLVPLNGGDPSSRAILQYALRVCLQAKARLILISVLPTSGGSGAGRDDGGRDDFESAEELLYAAGAQCATVGVDFSVIVEFGDTAERILSVCRDRDVDWIAMATRGRSGLSRWLLPSATHRILQQTRVPVLTVRSEPVLQFPKVGRLSVPGHS